MIELAVFLWILASLMIVIILCMKRLDRMEDDIRELKARKQEKP